MAELGHHLLRDGIRLFEDLRRRGSGERNLRRRWRAPLLCRNMEVCINSYIH
jgi:hypothetical protein